MNTTYPKELYDHFAQYVYKHAGIHYSEENYYQLDGRLKELSQLLELKSVNDLLNVFSGKISTQMHDYIIELATNNETSFFRDGRPFDLLKSVIFPELIIRNAKTKKISIWSAASSTGQEVYSILITWAENFKAKYPDWTLDVFGSDISERVLQRAKTGIYTQLEVQRGLPITMLMKHFKQIEGGRWEVKDELKKIPRFGRMNLLDGIFNSNQYDIVFCRNVLIYQSPQNKEIILNNIYKTLKPNGMLLMGAGESLLGMKTSYDKKDHKEGAVYFRPENILSKVA